MRMHIRQHATILTLCLSLVATAAFGGDGPTAPPAPATPPPADYGAAPLPPNSPDIDEEALRARVEAKVRREELAAQRQQAALRVQVDATLRREEAAERKQEAALRSQMDVARRRMEVDAQKLAALSAQMYGPMMQRVRMLAHSPHALIGVQLDSSSGAAGARVREVSPGGPAQQAGIRSGDLIVAVNGSDVRGKESAPRVVGLLRGVKPGDKVRLRVLRDGRTRELAVTARPDWDGLVVAPPMPPMPSLPPLKALSAWGGAPMIIRGPVADMELARLTPGLGRYFGTDAGVLVVRAPPGGALGLQDGDVILSIDGRKPIDSSHVIRILSSYDPGEKIAMEVMRSHRRIPVSTSMPAEPAMPHPAFMMRRGAVPGPRPVVR